MSNYTVRTADESHHDALIDALRYAFGGKPGDTEGWMEPFSHDVRRVVMRGDEVVGGLVRIPMAQWFGGRAVPTIGIAAVGIAPAHRGTSAATVMMQEVVREMHADGTPISTLYPATRPLYRRAGYELAGSCMKYQLDTQSLPFRDRELALRPGSDDDRPAIEAFELALGPSQPGTLVRGENMWDRVFSTKHTIPNIFIAEGDDGIEGYAVMIQVRNKEPHWPLFLWCRAIGASTRAGARRLLTLFRDHQAQCGYVSWLGAPADPLILQIPEHRRNPEQSDVWMVRLTHVENAMTARGYSPAVSLELHLDVDDDLLPDNGGRMVVRIADGAATVERGGDGRIAVGVRTLASLYTGFLDPLTARMAMELDCSDDDVASLAAAFGGPPPWMQATF